MEEEVFITEKSSLKVHSHNHSLLRPFLSMTHPLFRGLVDTDPAREDQNAICAFAVAMEVASNALVLPKNSTSRKIIGRNVIRSVMVVPGRNSDTIVQRQEIIWRGKPQSRSSRLSSFSEAVSVLLLLRRRLHLRLRTAGRFPGGIATRRGRASRR